MRIWDNNADAIRRCSCAFIHNSDIERMILKNVDVIFRLW